VDLRVRSFDLARPGVAPPLLGPRCGLCISSIRCRVPVTLCTGTFLCAPLRHRRCRGIKRCYNPSVCLSVSCL